MTWKIHRTEFSLNLKYWFLDNESSRYGTVVLYICDMQSKITCVTNKYISIIYGFSGQYVAKCEQNKSSWKNVYFAVKRAFYGFFIGFVCEWLANMVIVCLFRYLCTDYSLLHGSLQERRRLNIACNLYSILFYSICLPVGWSLSWL